MAPWLTNARPRAAQSKCPTPGTDKVGKYPAVARGGGGWAQMELTDALLSHRTFQDVDQGCLWESKGTQHKLYLRLGLILPAEFRTE